MTTGRKGYWRFSRSRTSRPSIPGRAMSSSTRSGASSPTRFRAAAPCGAVKTSKPSSCRMPDTTCRIWGSSSTTSSVVVIGGPVHGDFDDKPGASGDVVLHPDPALVVRHDGIDDGQAQAGAAPLGGEVGLKDPHLVPVRHPFAGIADGELHPVLSPVASDGHRDGAGPGDGGQGVVQQVEAPPFHLLPVQEDGRK